MLEEPRFELITAVIPEVGYKRMGSGAEASTIRMNGTPVSWEMIEGGSAAEGKLPRYLLV